MAEVDRIDNLVAARKLLSSSLEKSKALSLELDNTGPRLEGISVRLPALEAAFRSIPIRKFSNVAVRDQIECAIGPVAAVLKVYNTVKELEKSLLLEPRLEFSTYLSVMKQLEEAMKFLSNNCRLAIQWMEGIAECWEGNVAVDDRYVSCVNKSLRILQELQGTEVCSRQSGGVLFEALGKLVSEFKQLMTVNTIPFALTASLSFFGGQAYIGQSIIPEAVMKKLHAIIGRLKANGQLESCMAVYVEVRSSNIKRSLQSLDLEYLKKLITESDDVQDIEGLVDNCCEHLELVVKHVFEPERKKCKDVFGKIGSDYWMCCFAKIAEQSGIFSFLKFGKNVTESKKNPVKLLKLLDIFAVLDSLRVDINKVFGCGACGEIQALTRDLVKRVVNVACEIFWELPLRVEQQRQVSPPSNGSVPRLVSFVTEYCNELLGDIYRPSIIQVLKIHQSWQNEKYDEGLLANQIINIIKEIALNLDAWSSSYEDITLSYLFMMNNHCHFGNLKGTKLGEMLGDNWLRAHEKYRDYYAALYVSESWGKTFALLSQDDIIPPSVGRKLNARDLWKKKLKAFNEAFDCMYKKQSNWIVADKSLREKTCHLILQAFPPVYRSYLQNYGILVEHDVSASKHVKYNAHNLEKMLSSLFQPKLRKYASARHLQFIGKIKNVVTNQFHLMLTAK